MCAPADVKQGQNSEYWIYMNARDVELQVKIREETKEQNDISGQWKTIRIECFSFNRMQSFRMNTCFAYYDLYLVSSNNGKCTTTAAVLHFFGEKESLNAFSSDLNFRNFSSKKKKKQRQDDISAVKAFCFCFISQPLLFFSLSLVRALNIWIGKLFVLWKVNFEAKASIILW